MSVIGSALLQLLIGGLGYAVPTVDSVGNRRCVISTPFRRTPISFSECRSVSVIGQALVRLLLGGLGYLLSSVGSVSNRTGFSSTPFRRTRISCSKCRECQ